MDGHRFDRLTRALAVRGSRRRVARGLAATAAFALAQRADGALAHHGNRGPGDACWADNQCVAADAPLYCAPNGFADDGPMNCCAGTGDRCSSDRDCCYDAVCYGGTCTNVSSAPAPGEPCRPGDVCVAASGYFRCDYVVWTNDYRCCTDVGERCGWDGQCCGSSRCGEVGYCLPY